MGVERIARFTPPGYQFKAPGKTDPAACWLQVDLGAPAKIDTVKLLPQLQGYGIDAPGFPVRFKVEAAADPFTFFLERAKVALNDGALFGAGGQGFVRLNFGTPRALLTEGLERMRRALGA
jgi:hypothetical protein